MTTSWEDDRPPSSYGRFASWKETAPPRPPPWRRWLIGSALLGSVALLLYGCLRVVDGLRVPDEELVAEDREDFGYFTIDELRVGDCFIDDDVETATRHGATAAPYAGPAVSVVPCGRRHSAEVFHVVEMESDDGYPGAAVVERVVDECAPSLHEYVASPALVRRLALWYSAPTESTWDYAPQRVVCYATDANGRRRVGSLAATDG